MPLTSNNDKAAHVERIAIGMLRQEGYTIHRTVRTSQWRDGRWMSHANDIFGCIDIIAKRQGQSEPSRTRWIQITYGRGIGQKKKDLAPIPWDPRVDSVEIWRWVDGTGQRIDRRNGLQRDRLYFQVYLLDDGFQLVKPRRIRPVQPVAEQPVPDSG